MKRLLSAVLVTVAAVALAAAPAAADTVTVRKVDTTDFPDVRVSALVGGPAPTLDKFVLRENGKIVRGVTVRPLGETASPIGVVLVIDTSGSMRQGNKLNAAKAAAINFVESKTGNEEIAVVAFSDQPRVVTPFTKDAGVLRAAIDGLVASGETALWDGVRIGAGLFGPRPELQANLVVLSDGEDTVSTGTREEARSTVLGNGAVVFAVGLGGGKDFDEAGLRDLSSTTRGQYAGTTDPGALAGLFAGVHEALQNQYELSYRSASAGGALSLSLAVNGAEATIEAAAGTVSEGRNTTPEKVSGMPGVLGSSATLWIVLVLVLAAVSLFVWGVVLLSIREKSALEEALRPYMDDVGDDDDETGGRSYVSTPLMQKAVDATARLAGRQGVLEWAETKLEQAHVPLRPAEAVFFNATLAVVLMLLGFVLQGLFGVALAALLFGAGPALIVSARAARRQKKFTGQLPDMLQLLSSSLRSGYSLLQGLESSAQEVPEPMGWELRRVLVEARLGRPLETALDECAQRMKSPDFEWAVMAIRIQREVGGNLAELLETVGETMVARDRLRRDVRALTAEGRISAIILGAMPVGLGGFMYAVNPGYISILFHEGLGQVMLIGSAVMALFGFYWMKKTIEIEV